MYFLYSFCSKATISAGNEFVSNAIPKESDNSYSNESENQPPKIHILTPQLLASASRQAEDDYVPHHQRNVVDTTELLKRNQNVPYLLASRLSFDQPRGNVMQETVEFLDEGQKSLNLSDSDDVIIVVGNTGSGRII